MMRTLVQLAPGEGWLFLRTTILVAFIRVALWIFPFSITRKWLKGRFFKSSRNSGPARFPVNRLAWAVRAASRRIPQATCLTQALALQRLLARSGYESQLRIGVANQATRGFEAHAWLEHHGRILIGDDRELDRYSPILVLSSEDR